MGYYPRTYKYTLDDVMVDRARDGEPLLVDGQHRLFIAKVCGMEVIPVLVIVRHREYVDSRWLKAETDEVEQFWDDLDIGPEELISASPPA